MSKAVLCLLMFVCLFASACAGEPTVDTTTDESFQKSLERMKESLSEEKRKEVGKAMAVILMSRDNIGTAMAQAIAGIEVNPHDYIQQLNGLTADQIIAKGKDVQTKREQEAAKREAEAREARRKRDLEEIGRLEKEQVESQKALAELAKIRVLESKFYKRKGKYDLRPQPIIQICVKNDSIHPISRIYFKGTLASPERSIPWLVEDFNYQIPGGLEPGEAKNWDLAPNMFSEWGKVDAPKEAVLKVDVVAVDGKDGETLFENSFSDDDEKRLAELKSQHDM